MSRIRTLTCVILKFECVQGVSYTRLLPVQFGQNFRKGKKILPVNQLSMCNEPMSYISVWQNLVYGLIDDRQQQPPNATSYHHFSYYIMEPMMEEMREMSIRRIIRWVSAVIMIFGGVIPYIPQYREIYLKDDAEGFSLYVCLALLIANTLRILFWFVYITYLMFFYTIQLYAFEQRSAVSLCGVRFVTITILIYSFT